MRHRISWSLFTVTAIFCLLFATSSRGSEAVPVKEQYTEAHFPAAYAAEDNTPVLTAKTRLASGCYGISRRQQIPAPFNERQSGYAHLPELSFDWKAQQQSCSLSLSHDAGNIFISRIRMLLYPKHSFW